MKSGTVLLIFTIWFVFPSIATAQLYSVSGYVHSYITGKPIENVAVYETISGIGTITNSKGYYKLLLQKGKQEIKISSIGNTTVMQSFNLVSDTIISAELKPRDFTGNTVVENNKAENDSILKKLKAPNPKKR